MANLESLLKRTKKFCRWEGDDFNELTQLAFPSVRMFRQLAAYGGKILIFDQSAGTTVKTFVTADEFWAIHGELVEEARKKLLAGAQQSLAKHYFEMGDEEKLSAITSALETLGTGEENK
jgi:hypothetical protein